MNKIIGKIRKYFSTVIFSVGIIIVVFLSVDPTNELFNPERHENSSANLTTQIIVTILGALSGTLAGIGVSKYSEKKDSEESEDN